MMLSMSSEKLGDALSLTFSKCKIREGCEPDRREPSQQIAHILQVPVSFFFDGAPNAPGQTHDGFSEAALAAYVSTSWRPPTAWR